MSPPIAFVLQLVLSIGMVTSQTSPPQRPCVTPTLSCVVGGLNSVCKGINQRTGTAYCGTCKAQAGCTVLECVSNPDQSTCTADPVTCTKQPTGTGGFGITAPCGTSTIAPVQDPLVQPAVISSQGGTLSFTLTVQLATLNATVFSFRTRQFCYKGSCSVPGPTWKVKAGDTVTLTLQNDLPSEPSQLQQIPNNVFRAPNTVNMHTHGVHVDPKQDNVMEEVLPGTSKVYTYVIPSEHPGGTHWYHAHKHGSSTLHILGGLVGAIVIDDGVTVSPSYAAMAVTQLVFTHHPLCSCNPTSDPFKITSYVHQQIQTGDTEPTEYKQLSPTGISDAILTNGQYQPYLTLVPGEWRRFEMVLAVADVYLEIEIRSGGVGTNTATATACQMLVLGYDGVTFAGGPRPTTTVLFSIAGRVSLAVMCPASGTYYLQSNPQSRAADYEATFLQNLLTLRVVGTPVTMTQPTWPSGSLPVPSFLQDLQTTNGVYKVETGVEQTLITYPAGAWIGVGTDCTLECSGRGGACTAGDPNKFGSCAYAPFPEATGMYRFTTPLCSTVDWVINGRGATPHPMHIHVHHFQVVSAPDRYNAWGSLGDWRDTLPAYEGRTLVRFRPTKWIGPVMVHCHYLYHEDIGMMDRWWLGTPQSSGCTASSLNKTCSGSVPTEAFAMTFAAQTATYECGASVSPSNSPSTTTTSPTTTGVPGSTTTSPPPPSSSPSSSTLATPQPTSSTPPPPAATSGCSNFPIESSSFIFLLCVFFINVLVA